MMRHLALFLALPGLLASAQVSPTSPAKGASTTGKPVDFHETAPKPRPAAKSLRDAVDELSDADIKEFLTVVRENYLAPEKLNDAAVARATAQGLLDRLSPGILLPYGSAKDAAAADSPFRTEILEERIGYIRVGSISEERLGDLDGALKNFASRSLSAAILDLRATPSGSQFSVAAKICERFCPKGRVLFTIRRPNAQETILTSKQDPSFNGVLITLVDEDTGGAAEIVSAVLRTQAKALVIGGQTRGEAVEYDQVALPSGRKLRVAVAEVALPENVLVFPGGVVPDIPVDVSPEDNEKILKAGLENGVAGLVVETERARMNEAALVAGTNPELDAARAASASRGKKPEAAVRDAVLQRALDAITTIALFEQKAPTKAPR